eukprot:CAMPEP_0116011378 /NCGR_PEP_ID=MMETSP0321-20121206/4534_1 /TAXON_ID=163516 /ORGANISM="Leptocylindrus danicus var. danicus, Strain B650" /LENGTH=136 /DNA_ID=CAMNT_0003480603 /DNA_START=907 /DNA_END=1317 /DNA_ORIENTATION=+
MPPLSLRNNLSMDVSDLREILDFVDEDIDFDIAAFFMLLVPTDELHALLAAAVAGADIDDRCFLFVFPFSLAMFCCLHADITLLLGGGGGMAVLFEALNFVEAMALVLVFDLASSVKAKGKDCRLLSSSLSLLKLA